MTRISTSLALISTLVVAAPVRAATEPPLIQVDISEVPEAEDVRAEIEDAVVPLLGEHGIPPQDVRIKIIWLDANDFVAGVYASVDPNVDPLQTLVVKCTDDGEFCTPSKLPPYVRKAVQRSIQRLHDKQMGTRAAAPGDPPPTSATEATGDAPASEDPSPNEDPPARDRSTSPKRLTGMGWGGISCLLVGGAALGTGIGFVIKKSYRPDEFQQDMYVPVLIPGYVLLGVGGALMVTGSVLLGLDLSRSKRRRTEVSVMPSMGPGHAALSISGRF